MFEPEPNVTELFPEHQCRLIQAVQKAVPVSDKNESILNLPVHSG